MRTELPVALLLLLTLNASFTSPVHACRCVPRTPEEDFSAADAVFSGTVAAVTRLDSEVHAFVDWLEVWKGVLPAGTLVRVVTAGSSAECGFPFQEGEELVIFARAPSGSLETDSCTGTGQLTRADATTILGPPAAVHPLNVEFQRGDVNADGEIDVSDPIASLLFQFLGTFHPPCVEALDFDNNGEVELTDAVAELMYLFGVGPPPAGPFGGCGKDHDMESVDCASYPPCPPESDRHEIARVERIGEEVEVEVFSTRPFQPRALFPILCIGAASTFQSRPGEDGSLNRLIFTFPRETFDAIEGSQLVTVQHWEPCLADLDQQRLYWDLWVFGRIEL